MARRNYDRKMAPKSPKEKTKPIKEETKKAMMKEMTKSMPGLMDLPVEVLAKVFNFLLNQDIRRVSLACKSFYKICQDESLVPVKDLCIYGDQKRFYSLRDIEAVNDIIFQSKKLTSLKIKALSLDSANNLVLIALKTCPKLINLDIVETPDMAKGE